MTLQMLPLPDELSSRGMVLYMAEGEHPETWSHEALLTALRLYTGRTYTPEDVVRMPSEKPYLHDGSTEFSVTHSGEVWMVCIAPFPVGLDLQRHKEKYSPGVAKRYFHPSELALLEKAQADGTDLPLFFAIWCARESYAKFTGDGVAGMDKNYSTTDSPVPLYEIPFRQGYSLTICTVFEEEKLKTDNKQEDKSMLKLPSIFASGALYQQSTELTIHGLTDAGAVVDAELTGSADHPFSAARVTADETGAFALTMLCPAASMETWTITVTAGEERHVMTDILFGDLWLASGQSNMELSNNFQPEMDDFLASLGGRQIRVYHVDNIEGGCGGQFPYNPTDEAPGRWREITDRDFMAWMSAAGTAFVKEVYDYLRSAGREMPIGFINSSWGGTGIPAWIPRSAMDSAGALLTRMKELGAYPDAEKWNTRGDTNFQQPTCQYNWKIHCLVGVKLRGILWYQGENECWGEPRWRIYKDYLNLYHSAYRELFAACDDFPMISVLIYPWAYSKGDCWLGYLNQAFIDAARERPDTFYFTPISDLSPVWGFIGNHPIHPAHKYEVGKRLGLLAETAVYGKAGQKQPAVMDGYEVKDNRILVHFSIPGQSEPMDAATGIRIGEEIVVNPKKQKRPIGLYICGSSGTYVPADCEIIAPDTIALSHPGIETPVHAAYGYSSMEEGCNLWAGLYPLAYFRTDDKHWNADNTDGIIEIECKPWLDPTRTSVWTADLRPSCGDLLDVFYRPVWKASCGCEAAHDRAFTLADGSIRIALSAAEYDPAVRSSVIGASVDAHPYNRLDLQKYTALCLRMLNCEHTTLSLVLTYKEADGVQLTKTITAEKTGDLHHGWAEYRIPLEGIPEGEITKMEFRAALTDTYYHFVNLEGFVLLPR